LSILDVRMPPLDGIQVLNQIRKGDVYIPVTLHSGCSRHKREFAARFADAYLTKSSDLRKLRDKVEESLVFEKLINRPY
jgi:response regulator RpfG family c-di-GMP phosphodiesterase